MCERVKEVNRFLIIVPSRLYDKCRYTLHETCHILQPMVVRLRQVHELHSNWQEGRTWAALGRGHLDVNLHSFMVDEFREKNALAVSASTRPIQRKTPISKCRHEMNFEKDNIFILLRGMMELFVSSQKCERVWANEWTTTTATTTIQLKPRHTHNTRTYFIFFIFVFRRKTVQSSHSHTI